MQESEAAGDMSFAEYKRQRRAEQDDAEYPDEVCLDGHACQCLSDLSWCNSGVCSHILSPVTILECSCSPPEAVAGVHSWCLHVAVKTPAGNASP